MINPLKYFTNRRVGLALGSGGSKGIAHISVIEHLEALNIPIDVIAGTSIGALIGALHAAGSLKAFKEDLLKMQWKEMLSLVDPVFPKSGLLEGKRFIDYLTRYIPKDYEFKDLSIPLYVVATDLYSGAAYVFNSGNLLEAVRASISIPGVLIPVKYKDTLLVDGGVANPLPVDVLKKQGCGLTIAVNLHPTVYKNRLKNIVKKIIKRDNYHDGASGVTIIQDEDLPTTSPSGNGSREKWFKSLEAWFAPGKKKEKETTPNIFAIIAQSIDIMEYMNTMLTLKFYSPSVLIQPDLLNIPTLDFTHSARALMEGHQACLRERMTLKRKIQMWV